MSITEQGHQEQCPHLAERPWGAAKIMRPKLPPFLACQECTGFYAETVRLLDNASTLKGMGLESA